MSKVHGGTSVAEELERCGIAVAFGQGRAQVTVQCSTCPNTTVWTTGRLPEARLVKTKIRDRGWRVDKRRSQCPRCIKRERGPSGPGVIFHVAQNEQPLKETLTMPTPDPALRATASDAAIAGATMSDAARTAKRRAYELLLDHYDTDKRRYKDDYSDAKIAQITDLSVDKVAAIREEDFGPAGPPPALGNLKQQLSNAEARLRTIEKNIEQGIDMVTELKPKIEQMRTDIDKLVAAHGWEGE